MSFPAAKNRSETVPNCPVLTEGGAERVESACSPKASPVSTALVYVNRSYGSWAETEPHRLLSKQGKQSRPLTSSPRTKLNQEKVPRPLVRL